MVPTESLRKIHDYQMIFIDRVEYESGLLGPKSEILLENCRGAEFLMSLALKLADEVVG